MEPYKTIECDHGIKIQIYQDPDTYNPIQDCDGWAHVSTWHRRYDFGNAPKYASVQDFDNFCQRQREDGNPVHKLPVYLYDHSGLTVSTEPFSCPWDSGQVGWVWITEKEAANVMGRTPPPTEDFIEVFLRDTIRMLDAYLTGNVYGYQVEDAKGNVLESCWGFYGDLEVSGILEEAESAAEYCVEQAKLAAAEFQARRAKCFAI